MGLRSRSRAINRSGTVRIADTTATQQTELFEGSDGAGDLCLPPPPETPLGANLAAGIPTEDPDARQFWIWDSDPIEEEPCP